MVFPEGARSGSMTIREFKLGMFQFAIENGCDILPIALNNTHKAWSRNDVLDAADIHVAIGEVITINSDDKDAETLKNRVKAEIEKLIATLPNTCWDEPKIAPKEAETATAAPAGVKKEL